jgi:hypothetical protein
MVNWLIYGVEHDAVETAERRHKEGLGLFGSLEGLVTGR